MTVRRGMRPQPPRRNNAPIRRRKPATSVPDLLFALAAAGWTMSILFLLASFTDDAIAGEEAGRTLAQLFSLALFVASTFAFLLGFSLLRDDRGKADHYVFPLLLGAIIGVLEAAVFLLPASNFLFAPFILLIFVFRPVRRHMSRMLRPNDFR